MLKDTTINEVHDQDLEGRDVSDLVHLFIHKNKIKKGADSLLVKKYNFSIVPAAGYTLQTGFAGIVSANLGFYNYESSEAKLSNIASSITYSEYNQIIFSLVQS